ncbi:FadR family transcriptional regulator [Paenibacillus sp. HN-1]|uniref:FadR/GntR family transcriptional regulator n=1 Tax=Paenibacillus TaxID=44249 RepID=UPI001CA81323|nr:MULTISPECIES: FadR/GntR family transcriptional regulator [Paenibacillus]MBY9079101.1 FadR family transcriptional regulator [Paenibacillus sp. CGMCC 1.18879]MBY9086879.1 FadR family transcriptional regulator [Paenibacillus sinensis]
MKQTKQTAFQATMELMKQKIQSGEWAPGDRLPTLQQLAADFSVSVTTVREALRILESQGNVSIEHGRGMYVRNDPLLLDNPAAALKELEDISLVDLLEARLLIEPELAALAAQRADETQVRRLRELAERMVRQMEEGGPFFETDLAFHQLIAESASNPVLARMLNSILPLLAEGRKQTNTLPHMRTKASNYHILIAIAIEEHDNGTARQLMDSHIRSMLTSLRK